MKTTLAGAAALAILAVAFGTPPDASAQPAGPPRTGITGGATGQGPSGFQQGPTAGSPDAATRGTAPRSAMRGSSSGTMRPAKRTAQRQATAARPTDPRDRAYMDGGMVGGTTGSPMGSSLGSSPGPGAGGVSPSVGTTGGGTSSLQQSPIGGSSPNLGASGGVPARVGSPSSTSGTGPGRTGGVGSGNQPGTGGTSQGR